MRKFLISLLLLLIAIELELTFGAVGFFMSLSLGVLVACACELSLPIFIVLDLVAAIIFRTGSLADPSLLVLVLFPLVVGFFYRNMQWEPWALVPAVAALGAFLMALVSGVPLGTIGSVMILEDVLLTGVASLVAYGMVSWRNT